MFGLSQREWLYSGVQHPISGWISSGEAKEPLECVTMKKNQSREHEDNHCSSSSSAMPRARVPGTREGAARWMEMMPLSKA